MKRKDLEKLPVLRATTAMLKQAEQEPMTQAGYYKNKRVYAHDFYARCRRFGAILKVAFYKTELLAAGGRQPQYELFLNRKEQDFLTYAYAEKSWRTSMLHNLYRFGDLLYNIRFSERDEKLICEYLGSKEEPYRAIQKFQVNIREQQLLARHRKETDSWDAAMAPVPPLPKDWDRWVSKVGVTQNYMFYRYQRGGAKTGYCSYCDRMVPIRKPKHNTLTKCPRCRKQMQFKAFGKMGRVRTGQNIVYLMQHYPGGFVIREFWAERSYSRENYRNVKAFYHEFRRAIFDADAKPVQAFYWGVYKQRTSRWIEGYNCSANYARDESGRVYGKTILSLAKTVLQRTGLPELICAGKTVDPEKYLVVLKKIPVLERISKARLFRLARECARSYYWLENRLQKAPEQKGLAAILGIDRMELARLRRCDGGVVIFLNAIDADAAGAALHDKRNWIPGRPLPAGARIDRFEICGDPMVDVPQQKLHSIGIGLRRTVKRCFPLLFCIVLFLPIPVDGIPRGLKLEHDHPQAPRRKGQEQKWDEPCAAHQRKDRNDHTNQDGDTPPQGAGSFHKN